MVTGTSSEFGPHHTSRSPDAAPAASRPLPRRFTLAFNSANVVIEGRAPPLSSTITATLAGAFWAWTARASSGSFTQWTLCGGCTVVPVSRSFEVRGIVEGFYGPPWTHDARCDVISFLAPRGLNAYVYAPKDDAKHRAEWRTPYDANERAQFRELAAHAQATGVRFGFA